MIELITQKRPGEAASRTTLKGGVANAIAAYEAAEKEVFSSRLWLVTLVKDGHSLRHVRFDESIAVWAPPTDD